MNGLRAPITVVVGLLTASLGGVLTLAEVGSGNGPSVYLMFFVVLCVAGANLLATLWRPARLTGRLIALVAAAGLIGAGAGLAVERFTGCCMFAYHQTRGYPFAWFGRGFDSPDYLTREQAVDHMDATGRAWSIQSGQHLIADVVFWACVTLIAVVTARLVLGAVRARAAYAGQRDREPEPVDA